MTEFRQPVWQELPALRRLWREAFGESEEFLDLFFSAAYAPGRCHVAVEDGCLAAMLYWFDCGDGDARAAYLYGIATAKSHQGRGLATALMEKTQALLTARGYAYAVLVPAQESLFRFYAQRGYRTAGFLREETVLAGAPIACREISAGDYAKVRRAMLPPNALIQEGENLALLSGYGRFFAGDGWCAVYTPGECPVIAELLGPWRAGSGLVGALGLERATLRGPGGEKPFAMVRPLAQDAPETCYFAFAFD